MSGLSRREFIRMSVCALSALLTAGCARKLESPHPVPPTATVKATAIPRSIATSTPKAKGHVKVPPTRPMAQNLSLHPFIEAHPEAVFIRRTSVDSKTDSQAKKHAGQVLAASLFAPGDTADIPSSTRLAIKSNLTCAEGTGNTDTGMGILTDKFFVEGLIEGLKERGFPAGQMYLREGNWLGEGYCPSEFQTTGYPEMAQRSGVHLTDFPNGKQADQLFVDSMEVDSEITWKDVVDGVVFKRIPYVAPFNALDSWLLDVAKLKAHGMGLTLSAKNLQGMVVPPYTRFCEGVENTLRHPADILANFQPDLEDHVEQLYQAHNKAGYPRWERPGRAYDSGYGMEMWCQRTCDSLSVTPAGLAMVEGIYGRNGNFNDGPGPFDSAQDFMMNVVIFGKNPFLVDIIAVWLAGHEPGNLGLFHIAHERGLSPFINPWDVPLYLWEDEPRLVTLDAFERTPLLTNYLRKDYDGQNESVWHMLDEPFEYGTSLRIAPASPEVQVLGSRILGSASVATVIEYRMPTTGDVMLEVLDPQGERQAILAEGLAVQGTHAATWYHSKYTGAYNCRLHVDGQVRTAPLSV
jgi:hypothetical protein